MNRPDGGSQRLSGAPWTAAPINRGLANIDRELEQLTMNRQRTAVPRNQHASSAAPR
jgi:hypothetical protein